MDELENCILILQKNNHLEEVSKDVIDIERDPERHICNVTFSNGRRYPYSEQRILWMTCPQVIDLRNKLIYFRGSLMTDVARLLQFNGYYKIQFNTGRIVSCPQKDIRLVDDLGDSPEVRSVMSYLASVAQIVKMDQDEGDGFLHNELMSISISEDSILGRFLTGRKPAKCEVEGPVISPWISNQSQLEAIENALQSDMSVIQGPPGTGKTQTILNIIANLVVRGKTVAVVAGNNEAIRNILDKLNEAGLDGMTAFLGNNDNVRTFMSQSHPLAPFISSLDRFADKPDPDAIARNYEKIRNIYEQQTRLAELAMEKKELEFERRAHEKECSNLLESVPQAIRDLDHGWARSLELAAYIETIGHKKRHSLMDRLRLRFKYKIRHISKVLSSQDSVTAWLHSRYYEKKLEAIQADINIAESRITKQNEEGHTTRSEFQRDSMQFVKNTLHEKYKSMEEKEFSASGYRWNFIDFISRFPVVFSTTHSLHHCIARGYMFDYLIVDEASQVDLCSAAVALSCARRLVCVGDSMQLPHVVRSSDRKVLGDLFGRFNIPRYMDYTRFSLLQSITSAFKREIPATLLREHFRCDPEIIGFCNRRFYDGQLIISTKHIPGNGVRLITTGSHFTRGRTNQRQCDVITTEILPQTGIEDVGIVTPYRNQVDLLRKNIPSPSILIDTVHKFQGKEKSIMIMSTVSDRIRQSEDDEECDFLDNPNLINVAISRAKEKLYIVASDELMDQKGTIFNDFLLYSSYYSSEFERRRTGVYSVFDLMYHDYAPVLADMGNRLLGIAQEKSEDIIATVLRDIKNSRITHPFGFVMHYRLSRILDITGISDAQDRAFVSNPNTHCDFLIFNTMDKSPVLALEVDGSQHETDAIQKVRDKRKDRLLTEAGISMLRLKTTGIAIEDKVIDAIRHAFDQCTIERR